MFAAVGFATFSFLVFFRSFPIDHVDLFASKNTGAVRAKKVKGFTTVEDAAGIVRLHTAVAPSSTRAFRRSMTMMDGESELRQSQEKKQKARRKARHPQRKYMDIHKCNRGTRDQTLTVPDQYQYK